MRCSYTNTDIKLVMYTKLLVEDYRGLPYTIRSRSSAKIGSNPWNNVEGVASNGVHWPSAVRYTPVGHQLRKKFLQEFKESPVIQAIAKMKAPTRRTTADALKCAENFLDGEPDAEFVGVSQFWGTSKYPVVFSLLPNVVSLISLFLSPVCLLFVSCLSLVCLLFVSCLCLVCVLFVSCMYT